MKRLDPTKISSKMRLEMLKAYLQVRLRGLHGKTDRDLGQIAAFTEISRMIAELENGRKGK